MGRTLVCAITMMALLVISTVALTPSAATDYSKVGLRVGDTADYLVHRYYGQTYRYHVIIWRILAANVTGIGTVVATQNVIVNETIYHVNGTLYERHNASFNNAYLGGLHFDWLIACGLQPGDRPYWDYPPIQKTVKMFTAGASREVNMLSVNDGLKQCYWDKETGLLVKSCTEIYPDGSWDNATLEQTTAWTTTGTDTIMVVGIVAGISVACTVVALPFLIYRRKRRQ